jgi:Uma2 family endonuclease
MADPARKLTAVDEFLRFDGETGSCCQLFGGRIVIMAPPGRTHGMLAMRIRRALGNRLAPPCEPQGEAGILPPGPARASTSPTWR